MRRPEKIILPDVPPSRRRSLFARAPREPLRAFADNGATVVSVYGPIGDDGISANDFHDQLASITGNIVLRVHSPGGDPLAAISMFNDIAAHAGHVRAEVPAIAASAASIL